MPSINYISQGETTSKNSELEQGENDMNTDLNNSNHDQGEEKMYGNSNKTDEMSEGMKEKEENFEKEENDMNTNKENTENGECNMNKEENNLGISGESLIEDAIKTVRGFIQKEEEAINKRKEVLRHNKDAVQKKNETGIDLLISLCEQTTKIEQSEQAKKLLKEKVENLLKEEDILNEKGKGRKPEYEEVFLQLFYLSFNGSDVDIKTNAFSQKKSTYYKAYKYCAEKYKDCLGNFETLKNRLKEKGIKSVRFLADIFIRPDKDTDQTDFKSYKDDDKMFSINKELFKKITENKEDYNKTVEIDGFLITISVSKKELTDDTVSEE